MAWGANLSADLVSARCINGRGKASCPSVCHWLSTHCNIEKGALHFVLTGEAMRWALIEDFKSLRLKKLFFTADQSAHGRVRLMQNRMSLNECMKLWPPCIPSKQAATYRVYPANGLQGIRTMNQKVYTDLYVRRLAGYRPAATEASPPKKKKEMEKKTTKGLPAMPNIWATNHASAIFSKFMTMLAAWNTTYVGA